MQVTDLELYTTKELVGELMRRKTFLGVVVHSEEDHKDRRWMGEKVFPSHPAGEWNAQSAAELAAILCREAAAVANQKQMQRQASDPERYDLSSLSAPSGSGEPE